MSLLTLSTNQIIFQSGDSYKTVLMTNVGGGQHNRKPIMYKIKTNKIDYVDAKPSCGYISGLKGQNQINVIIRSLTSKKEFNAKLQILYVSHEKITQQLVEKNKKHFDLIEYNELYDSIKQGNQSDVKTAIINVTRKGVDPAQEAPIDPHSDSKTKSKIAQLTQSIKDKSGSKYQSIPTQKKKGSGKGLFLMLLIGLLLGFLLGTKYGTSLGLFNEDSLVQKQQHLANGGHQQKLVAGNEENTINNEQSKQQQVVEPQEQVVEPQEVTLTEQVLQQKREQAIRQEAISQENDEDQERVDEVRQVLIESIKKSQAQINEDMVNEQEPQQESVIITVNEDTL